MSSVIEIKFDVRFREKHQNAEGEDCDPVIYLEVSNKTFEKAMRAEDPLSVLPEVVCPDCGTKLDIPLVEWQHTIERAVGEVRRETERMAEVAYALAIKVHTQRLVSMVKENLEHPDRYAGSVEHYAEHFVKHAMLNATDIAREQVKDLARLY